MAINKVFSYLPYLGVNSFAYFGCTIDDIEIAEPIANVLVNKGFRLYLDARGTKQERSVIELSNSIEESKGAIVFLSKKSIESLAYRNIINNLISLNKKTIFIKIGEFDLTYGLDMQLANLNVIPYTNYDEIVDALLSSEILTQDMIGEGMEKRETSHKKAYIMVAMVVVCLLIFVFSAISIVNKMNSAEYILKDVNDLEYLNIAEYGDVAIEVLKGRNFDELDLSFGAFESLNGLEDINVKTINVSDITNDLSLSSLKNIKGLQTVKISQNQIKYADELSDGGIRVIITH